MGFLYYSTQTELAHRIAVRYYKNIFFAYCSTEFNPKNPSSSNPASLYELHRSIVEGNDKGNARVTQHRTSLINVAQKKLAAGEITQVDCDTLEWEVETAEIREYSPILYLILRSSVQNKTTPLPVQLRAASSSEEYTIAGMIETDFEIIKSHLRLSGGV